MTRAFAVDARTLELLDARGLADELLTTATAVDRLHVIGGAVLDLGPSGRPRALVRPACPGAPYRVIGKTAWTSTSRGKDDRRPATAEPNRG